MPSICEFYGIKIQMHLVDHGPPHFHAVYGKDEAVIAVESGKVVAGELPSRALALVQDWVMLHRHELEENWNVAQARQALFPIAPL